ncbi:MAG: hypothetical protein ACRD3P_17595 [Terriglobales bacterium]
MIAFRQKSAIRGKTVGVSANNVREDNRFFLELQYYAAHKEEWLRTPCGEYVVVQDTELLGFFGSWHEAFRSGVQAFGVGRDILVKQVLAQDPVYFIF